MWKFRIKKILAGLHSLPFSFYVVIPKDLGFYQWDEKKKEKKQPSCFHPSLIFIGDFSCSWQSKHVKFLCFLILL